MENIKKECGIKSDRVFKINCQQRSNHLLPKRAKAPSKMLVAILVLLLAIFTPQHALCKDHFK